MDRDPMMTPVMTWIGFSIKIEKRDMMLFSKTNEKKMTVNQVNDGFYPVCLIYL